MSSLFDELKEGLEEAIDHAKGTPRASTRSQQRALLPPPPRTPAGIKRLRLSLGKTQDAFAQLVGATKKAVEAWESGVRKPSGSALRLFQVLEVDAVVVESVSHGTEPPHPEQKVRA